MNRVVYVLCFISFSIAVKIPASFVNSKYDYNNYYVLDVDLGFPRKPYKLALDFTSSGIVLYQPIDKISNSYSNDGTDYIYIGSHRYRAPISFDYYIKSTLSGTFGFNKSSFIWKYFSEISISASGIQLGIMHDLIKNNDGCNVYISNCIESNHLCTTRITLNKVSYDMSFSGKSQNTIPSKMFNQYMLGKNIFSDSPQKWSPINVQLNQRNSFSKDQISYFSSQGLDILNCRSNVNFSINGEDLFPQAIKSPNKLLMNSHDKNEVVIGLDTWKNYIVYYNQRHDVMIVKNHAIQAHFSFGNIFSFCALLTLFVRFKLINTGKMVTREHESNNGKYVLSMPITLYLFCLSVTREILDGYTGFTISIGLVIILFMCMLSYSILKIFWQYKKVSFIYGSINSVAYDNIMLYGMLLALVERRVDGLESFFTLVINIIIIYCIAYHLLIVIGYIFLMYPTNTKSSKLYNIESLPTTKKEKSNIKPYFWFYALIFLPTLFGFQLYITYVLFAFPMICLWQPELTTTLKFLLLFNFFMIVIAFSLYMSAMSVSRAMHELIDEKKK
jgi:hypothetical protein